jgi:hypothetical protein
MKNIDDLFPSRFLKAADLKGDTPLTINNIKVEDIRDRSGEDTRKGVLYFDELEKGLPLNKTNAETIATLHGRAFATWPRKRITLSVTPVSTPEGVKDGIRVRDSVPLHPQEAAVLK